MNKSFTLIEILVVVVVVGILSSFILVGMSSITNSANIAKLQVFSNSLDNALLLNRVSYWKLDGDANDSWGINTGAITGATLISSGCVKNSCYNFDGSDDIIDFGNDPSLSMGINDHTISVWVKFDNTTAPQGEMLIACGVNGVGLNLDGYKIRRQNGTSRLEGLFTDGSNNYISGNLTDNGILIANVWYNIVVIFNRDGSMQSYIDGQLQSGYLINISAQQGDVQNSANLRIGAWDVSSYRLDGKIDELRIYHAILSSQLIDKDYYFGINNLLINSEIGKKEFHQRIVDLKYTLTSNKNTLD